MTQNLRILLIDDNPDDRELSIRELKREFENLEVKEILEAEGFEKALKEGNFDLAITDYQLGWTDGIKILRAIKAKERDRPVIVFTNSGNEEVAVEAMKSGAEDYVIKSPKHFRRLANVVRSVWKRTEAQRRVALLEIRLNSLMNRLDVGVFRCTPAGKILECNLAFLQILGWNSLGEVQAINLQHIGLLPTALENREYEVLLERTDGSRFWVVVNTTLSVINNETVIEGILENINERKRQEEREHFLAEASKILSSSLDYENTLSNVAQLLVPQLADKALIYLLEEQAQIRRLAVSYNLEKTIQVDELQPYTLDTSSPDAVTKVLSMGQSLLLSQVNKALAEKDINRLEDQEDINFLAFNPESLLLVPLIVGPKVIGAISLISSTSGKYYDADDMNLVEEFARRAALGLENARLYREAQEANHMKDEFLATLSHELRSPLNAIVGWASLLRTRKLDQSTLERALETIERNAKSQTQLIEDLLDVSRMIRGKLCLNKIRINLVKIIDTVIEAVRPTADAKSIEIVSTINSANSIVLADPDRLQQVIWNLLSNAIKFTSTGGKVEVQLSLVKGDLETGERGEERGEMGRWGDGEMGRLGDLGMGGDGERKERGDKGVINFAQIQVIDTGSGIKPEFLPYVFDRFRQADASTTRSHGGLGLGLAIVRHLVELHGGTVCADSKGKGMGATFTVRLPLYQSKDENIVDPLVDAVSLIPNSYLNGLQILVVDDEKDTRDLINIALTDQGANIKAVASAHDAMLVLNSWQPEILISDIGMPDQDGYKFIQLVREQEKKNDRHITAIALTAFAREEDRQRALTAGFDLHISKPVNLTELILLLSDLSVNT